MLMPNQFQDQGQVPHSGQASSPQSYPVTSSNATPHGRPGMMSPMNMPQNVMLAMNPPSQSPQPSMSSGQAGMSPQHSGQLSPQSYPVTSPNATRHGRPGMTSPMNMPQKVMSAMNPPSQSPQPSMSPKHFNQQQQPQNKVKRQSIIQKAERYVMYFDHADSPQTFTFCIYNFLGGTLTILKTGHP